LATGRFIATWPMFVTHYLLAVENVSVAAIGPYVQQWTHFI